MKYVKLEIILKHGAIIYSIMTRRDAEIVVKSYQENYYTNQLLIFRDEVGLVNLRISEIIAISVLDNE